MEKAWLEAGLYCYDLGVTTDGIVRFVNGFIGHLHTQLVTTCNTALSPALAAISHQPPTLLFTH
jgi:hypothetical protein